MDQLKYRVHDYSADARAVAADELRCGVNDDVGAPFDWAAEIRGRERVIDDERKLVFVRERGELRDVEHVAAGVPDRLAVKRLGIVANRPLPPVNIVWIDPCEADVHLPQQMFELVDRAAVERR